MLLSPGHEVWELPYIFSKAEALHWPNAHQWITLLQESSVYFRLWFSRTLILILGLKVLVTMGLSWNSVSGQHFCQILIYSICIGSEEYPFPIWGSKIKKFVEKLVQNDISTIYWFIVLISHKVCPWPEIYPFWFWCPKSWRTRIQ